MISILFLYALAASNFTIAKAVLDYSHPIFFIGVRMLVAGSLLLGFLFFKDKKLPVIQKSDYLNFGLIILFHIYLAFVLDLVALQDMTSSKGALIYNLSPFFTALLSYFMFHERMTLKKYLGFAVGFLGVMPMMIASAPTEKLVGIPSYLSWAELCMLGSVIASVIGWTLFRKLIHKGYSPMVINAVGMFAGGALALATSRIIEAPYWNPTPISNLLPFIGLTALIIIVANFLFYNLYGWMLTKYTATFLSFAGFITPLLTALFGWLFLGETVNWHFFVSVFFVALGLTIFYSEELKQGYIKG